MRMGAFIYRVIRTGTIKKPKEKGGKWCVVWICREFLVGFLWGGFNSLTHSLILTAAEKQTKQQQQ